MEELVIHIERLLVGVGFIVSAILILGIVALLFAAALKWRVLGYIIFALTLLTTAYLFGMVITAID